MDESFRMRLRQKIAELIDEGSRTTGETDVMRRQIEEIGLSVGMAEEEACHGFLALKGVLWDVPGTPGVNYMKEDFRYPPPWHWLYFTNVRFL